MKVLMWEGAWHIQGVRVASVSGAQGLGGRET